MSGGTVETSQSARAATSAQRPLFETADWDFQTMQRAHDAIEEIALDELKLDVYPNQIEIISAEQMLDAYCSIGMPLMYGHWSFGKKFVHHEKLYRYGYQALAYEIVINSNPCISYYMEENTMAMQTLVIAHAAFGHNHFYKNNYLFKQWTDPEGVLDYLDFAKKYVAECEERHGASAVEETLDAAHALMNHGVFRYKRRAKMKMDEVERRTRERRAHEEKTYSDLWRTVPHAPGKAAPPMTEQEAAERKRRLNLPEENILYFIEKNSPILREWQRELLRIVRNISQYFYPQRQTKLMNEGCATFVHYHIVNRLYDKGLIPEGALLEILHSHSDVTFQPGYDDQRYSGVNPYALGFAMMQDIQRVCVAPTAEDREWLPDIAGNGDWLSTLKDVWANYRDESFVRQFMTPHLMRKFKFFSLDDKAEEPQYRVEAIHNDEGYRMLRSAVAESYDLSESMPDIQVVDVDLLGDRNLILRHNMRHGVRLAGKSRDKVLTHMRRLWGYGVRLQEFDAERGAVRDEVGVG
jgi:stage V sporulation protein R